MQLRLVLMLAFWLPFLLHAQPKSRPAYYRNLVLEGGGMRAIAYGGVFQELEKRGALDSIVRIGGNSAGAIYGMMLAVGYSGDDIDRISASTPAKEFMDGNVFLVAGVWRVIKKFGWSKGKDMRKWLGELLKGKTGNCDLTFRQLHEMVLKHDPGKRDLYVAGTNLSKQRLEIFSWETYPDMKIRDAVRISAGIPLYMRAIFMDSTGRIYRRLRESQKTDVLIDGGVIGNYPIHIFDDRRYMYTDSAGGSKFNPQTLGIRVDSDAQVKAGKTGVPEPYPIRKFDDFMIAFYYMVLENLNRPQLTEKDWDRTITVSTAGMPPRISHITDKERAVLIDAGKKAVQEFWEKE